MTTFLIRAEEPDDEAGVRQVNLAAFARPGEACLVDLLRQEGVMVASLVAVVAGQVVGTVMFHEISLEGAMGDVPAVVLAPLAVAPKWQGQGIGSALTREGLRVCGELNRAVVVLLGHPTYYPRFGFSAELASKINGPWHSAAFMAVELVPGALAGKSYRITRIPEAFSRFEETPTPDNNGTPGY